MINVAIIEDDISSQNDIKNFLSKYGKEKNEEFNTSCFISGEQFLSNYKATYDLILMDIELPGINGMETSKKLRQMDNNTVLVFITNMAQFAIGGYEVGAFDFILKPITYASFYLKFARIMQKINSNVEQITIRGKQFSKRINTNNIMYVEVSNHDLIYHTLEGNINGHGSMKLIKEQFENNDFSLCNQSYLVNLKYIKEVHNNEVKVGNDWLIISRPKKKEFLKKVNEFFNNKGE